MIKRISDFSSFNEKELLHIKNIVSNKRELYKICKTQDEVDNAINILDNNKLKHDIVKQGSYVKIYYFNDNKIDINEAKNSNQFEKIAFNRYYFNKQSSLGGLHKYNFDDGSIWKVIQDKNGKEYLVKEVEENQVIRNPVLTSVASFNIENKELLVEKIIMLLYNDDNIINFINDIQDDKICDKVLQFFNKKVNKSNDELKIIYKNILNDNITSLEMIN